MEALDRSEDPRAATLWLETGDWARFVGALGEARVCYTRAAEQDPATASLALRALAEVAAEEGAPQKMARALAAAWEIEARAVTEPAARARAMAEIGFAHLRARQLDEARRWLEQAVTAFAGRGDARTALVRLAGEDRDARALERWVASAPPELSDAPAWWQARAEAWEACGQPEAAAERYERTLRLDPEAWEAAEGLARLGLAEAHEPWRRAGLDELTRRAAASSQPLVAFLASAVQTAYAPEAVAASHYRPARVRLGAPRTRAADAGWVAAWLGCPPGAEAAVAPEPSDASSETDEGMQALLTEVAALFGLTPPILHFGEAWAAEPGRLIVPRADWPSTARARRFWLGRGCLAILDAGARPALTDEARMPDQVRRLDRAGLLAAVDPAVALAEIGPTTVRGRALARFALSSEYRTPLIRLGVAL